MNHRDDKLWEIVPIVTPDKQELGTHRMRVPGGWVVWLRRLTPSPSSAASLFPAAGQQNGPGQTKALGISAASASATASPYPANRGARSANRAVAPRAR